MIDVLVVGGVFREILDADTTPRPRYGGSGLTAAVAAARLGATTALAGSVGAEDRAAVEDLLASAGVESALKTLPGASGTFAFPTQIDGVRPWPLYRPAEARPDGAPQIPNASLCVVFGIPEYDAIMDGWLAERTAPTVLWDRQGWLSRARDGRAAAAVPAARRVYVANLQEAVDDAGAPEEIALATQPPEGFTDALIKAGAQGVHVFDGSSASQLVHVAAFATTATNIIGSGDVFAGAVAARLTQNPDLAGAVVWGCAAAAVSIQSGANLLREGDVEDIRELALSRRGLR